MITPPHGSSLAVVSSEPGELLGKGMWMAGEEEHFLGVFWGIFYTHTHAEVVTNASSHRYCKLSLHPLLLA